VKARACCVCGDPTAKVVPVERRGLKNPAARAKYAGRVFCWSCWYWEAANEGLYKPLEPGERGLRDRCMADQFGRFTAKSVARTVGYPRIEQVTPDDLMALVLAHDARSAITGRKGRLVFDHIIPLADGGPHVYENLRPLLQSENWIEQAIYFGLSPDDPRVYYRDQRRAYLVELEAQRSRELEVMA
jgi:HNH endonuclease